MSAAPERFVDALIRGLSVAILIGLPLCIYFKVI